VYCRLHSLTIVSCPIAAAWRQARGSQASISQIPRIAQNNSFPEGTY